MHYELQIGLVYTDHATDTIKLEADGNEIKRFFSDEILTVMRECLTPGVYVKDGHEPGGMIITCSWEDEK